MCTRHHHHINVTHVMCLSCTCILNTGAPVDAHHDVVLVLVQ